MDTSTVYSDSPMEQDDAPIPCKGCGEVRAPPLSYPSYSLLAELSTPNANDIYAVQILEEGKAFELGTCLQNSNPS